MTVCMFIHASVFTISFELHPVGLDLLPKGLDLLLLGLDLLPVDRIDRNLPSSLHQLQIQFVARSHVRPYSEPDDVPYLLVCG